MHEITRILIFGGFKLSSLINRMFLDNKYSFNVFFTSTIRATNAFVLLCKRQFHSLYVLIILFSVTTKRNTIYFKVKYKHPEILYYVDYSFLCIYTEIFFSSKWNMENSCKKIRLFYI